MLNLPSKNSASQNLPRGLQLWTAMASALVPILIAACSSYRGGVPYFELGSWSIRSMPFIETSIFAIGLYVFIRWFRKEDLPKYLAWVLIFLFFVTFGVGYAKFFKSPGDLQGYLSAAGIILMDFAAAITFGIAYRLAQKMMHRR
ncbi:MAG: hypothetical protein ACYC0F_01355 [Rhodanobacter sp.]